jgi:hypothetical protein
MLCRYLLPQMVDAGALPLSSTPLQQSDPLGPSALQLNMQPQSNQRLQAQHEELAQFPDTTMAYMMSLDGANTNHLRQQQQQQEQKSVSLDWTSFLIDINQDDQGQQQQQQQQQQHGHHMPTQAAPSVGGMPTPAAAAAAARFVGPAPGAAAAVSAADGAGWSKRAVDLPGTIEVSCGAVFGMYDVIR